MLGSCGAWPAAGLACSGYLVEHDNFKLLVDAGYAILPKLLEITSADSIDAVLISHGHPDHCADLNPLLRARALADRPPKALPIHTLVGAVDGVLALDRPGMLDEAYAVRNFTAGDRFEIGPFGVETFDLPHFVPNVGVRLTVAGRTIAYTGDSGPSPSLAELAKGADLFLAEATFADTAPFESQRFLSTARQAGDVATAAGVQRLVLTHLWPGSDPNAAIRSAGLGYRGSINLARSGDVTDLDSSPPR